MGSLAVEDWLLSWSILTAACDQTWPLGLAFPSFSNTRCPTCHPSMSSGLTPRTVRSACRGERPGKPSDVSKPTESSAWGELRSPHVRCYPPPWAAADAVTVVYPDVKLQNHSDAISFNLAKDALPRLGLAFAIPFPASPSSSVDTASAGRVRETQSAKALEDPFLSPCLPCPPASHFSTRGLLSPPAPCPGHLLFCRCSCGPR